MKTSNSYKSLLCATLTAALFTACANEELINPTTGPVDPRPQITIQASLGDNTPADALKPGTRMGYEDDGNTSKPGLKTTWTKGDAFNIVPQITVSGVPKDGTPCLFTLVGEGGSNTGTFKGPKPEEATYGYYIFHPASINNNAEFDAFSYEGQMQTGNDNTNHLTAYHCIQLNNGSYTDLNFINAPIQSSCMKFNLTMPDAIDPVLISLKSGNGACFYPTNKETTKVSSLSMQLNNISIAAGEKLTAYMMMSTKKVTLPGDITVTVTGKDGTNYSKTISVAGGTELGLQKMHSITVASGSWTKSTTPETNVFTVDMPASDGLNVGASGGNDGTDKNPYLITSAADLKFLQGVTNGTITGKDNFKDKCYKLTTDIIIATGGTSWTPINDFKGTFDGDGYSITGLYINNNVNKARIGFFGYIGEATVKNLTVVGKITSKGDQAYVGGIVGSTYSSVTTNIINCHYRGSLTTMNATAVGGICGQTAKTLLLGCSNTANLMGNTERIGGIVGIPSITTDIVGCYNTGTVRAAYANSIGGIAGYSDVNIYGCYNTGDVIGEETPAANVGGIVGTLSNGNIKATIWVPGSKTTATNGVGTEDGSATVEITTVASLWELNNIPKHINTLNDAIVKWYESSTTSYRGLIYLFEKGSLTPVLAEIDPS